MDTASEALAVSLSEKAQVDLGFMSELSGKSEDELVQELSGVIYRNIRCGLTPEEISPVQLDLAAYPYVTAENWRKGKRTHLFIDEFHVVFQNPYSADFFDSAWRRFRKRGAYPTAITQNVEYLLDSVQASTMLSNSEMLILLNQAPSDREKLAALLNISPEQTSYITNAPAGCGLLRYGGALVPFRNQFPKDTELYRLMTTKPDESIIVGGKTR